MKNLKFFLPFAALGLLASCSNDNIGEPTPTPDPVETDGYYACINVAMSGTTKALESYDEGTTDENAIENLTLYLFKAPVNIGDGSTPESVASLIGTVNLFSTGFTTDATAGDDIAKVKSFVGKLPGVDKDDADNDYYGLVVANAYEGFPVFSNDGIKIYDTWNQSTVSADGLATTNIDLIPTIGGQTRFTMVNAPQVLDNKATTLVKINKSEFKITPTLATTPAATFYIQRGVAKVKVGVDATNTDNTLQHIAVKGSDDYVIIKNWSLDITNKTSYPGQNVTKYSNWSALGTKLTEDPSGVSNAEIKHIWWAEDPNYSTNPAEGSFNTLTGLAADDNLDANKVMYCFENTSVAQQQAKDRMTRVVFRAEYVFDGQSEAKDFIVYNDNGLAMPLDTEDLTTSETPRAAGVYKISDLIASTKLEEVIGSLKVYGPDANVTYYPGGVTYYTAYIKHFGGTPKAGADKVNALTEYDADEDLGIYGVLRNNSYVVNINQVLGYGSYEIPTPGPDPVDKPDPDNYNMMFSIKILKWATRSDSYDIK